MKAILAVLFVACAVTGGTAFLAYSGGEKQPLVLASQPAVDAEEPAAEEGAAEGEQAEPAAEPEVKTAAPQPQPKAETKPAPKLDPKKPGAAVARTEEKVAAAMGPDKKPKPAPKADVKEPPKHGEEPTAGKEEPPKENGSETPSVKPTPRPVIALPPAIGGMQFGMAAKAVAQRAAPAWSKQEKDMLMLVYYFDKTKVPEARLEFREKGLERIELRYRESNKSAREALYGQMQERNQALYGSLPGSTETKWSDGHMTLCVGKGRDYVSLLFTPAE